MAGPNLYVFSFSNATTRDWVLENGPWHVQHKPLVLRKWESNLRKLDFDLARMPVWVQLYNVPLELYSRCGLSYIASAIGYPLYMDSITTSKERLEFTKVCVEIAAGARIPRVVSVQLRDKSVTTVKVSVPWMPACCSKCKTFGHTVSACVVENPHTHKEWVVKSKDMDVLSFPLGSLEERGDSSNDPLNDKTFADSTIHDVEGVTEDEANAMVRNSVVSIGVSTVVETIKEKSISLKDSTGLEVDGVTKAILDCNLGEFPPLQDSVRKKKGNEKGAKGFEDPKIMPEGMTRKPKAAAMGVANLLQEMKAKKKHNIEKIKGSCVDVANQRFRTSLFQGGSGDSSSPGGRVLRKEVDHGLSINLELILPGSMPERLMGTDCKFVGNMSTLVQIQLSPIIR
ncbi:hypothetical protein V6N13_047711 [Hibiscus sabdariffa]